MTTKIYTKTFRFVILAIEIKRILFQTEPVGKKSFRKYKNLQHTRIHPEIVLVK